MRDTTSTDLMLLTQMDAEIMEKVEESENNMKVVEYQLEALLQKYPKLMHFLNIGLQHAFRGDETNMGKALAVFTKVFTMFLIANEDQEEDTIEGC